MTTQTELDIERAKTQGARVTFEFLKWLLAHGIVFKQCAENMTAISSYLKETGSDWSLLSAVNAYNELTKRGHKFLLDKLAPPVVAEEELPPLPVVPGMGEPQIFTKDDIDSMPRDRYKRLYFGAHAAEFRARVTEIIRRAKAEAAKERE